MTLELGNFNKTVFLSGAGFSRNWSGFLVSEFFNRLISHQKINSSDNLRTLLLTETNFETALHIARTQNYTDDEIKDLERAILDVFLAHDYAIGQTGFFNNSDINIYGVQGFLSRFYGQIYGSEKTGYLFTLNQDLLLERKYYNHHPAPTPVLPGIRHHPHWFNSLFGADNKDRLPHDYIRIVPSALHQPEGDWPPRLVRNFNYIKLHGSFDWRDPSGNELLVIGGGKLASINRSPILKFYHDVFSAVCLSGNVKLFITGYSFGDEHINNTIASGVNNANLKIYIHNTTPTDNMRKILDKRPYGNDIWKGLIGYSFRSLIEIFPGDQRRTEELESIEKVLFG